MADEKIYPTDIWEYLGDMSYMPSRQDRDQLVQAGEENRVRIWDYFFRIDPNDVGKPQKLEITDIKKHLSEIVAHYIKDQQEIQSQVVNLQRTLFQKKLNNFFYGISSFLIAGAAYKFISDFDISFRFNYLCILLPACCGILLWFSISFIGWDEKSLIRDLLDESNDLREIRDLDIKKQIGRKNILRAEIKGLKKQIPAYPSDIWVREWLRDDFKKLWQKSIEVTALSNRLIKIESDEFDERGNQLVYPNPIYVLGPGELQHPDKIPLTFSKKIRPDLNKHLTAKRSFYMANENRFEVLYGVYYLEHILIADDMLATYGLFYDFITGKCHAEQITEQYYQDVVAITTTHEFRKIPLGVEVQETKYVEDAPTFTLSLASGEHRTVTFVSKKYFMEIKEKINMNEDDISRIYWIGRSQMDADMAVKALRSQLRLHKIILQEE